MLSFIFQMIQLLQKIIHNINIYILCVKLKRQQHVVVKTLCFRKSSAEKSFSNDPGLGHLFLPFMIKRRAFTPSIYVFQGQINHKWQNVQAYVSFAMENDPKLPDDLEHYLESHYSY